MGSITSAFCTSAKSELFSAAHCTQATVTPTATAASASATLTNVSSLAGVVVGMAVSGTSIAAGSVIASLDSSTQATMSKATTASITGGTLTITGDTYKMALFKNSVTGTYSASTVNYTDMTGNSDEASGTGYTATGTALTNVSPTTSGTTAYINWSPNPSWTSASFSTDGCMIYNTNARLGGTSGTNTQGAGRCLGVFSFGGTQTVSSGTLTVLFPSATSSTAIFRLA